MRVGFYYIICEGGGASASSELIPVCVVAHLQPRYERVPDYLHIVRRRDRQLIILIVALVEYPPTQVCQLVYHPPVADDSVQVEARYVHFGEGDNLILQAEGVPESHLCQGVHERCVSSLEHLNGIYILDRCLSTHGQRSLGTDPSDCRPHLHGVAHRE